MNVATEGRTIGLVLRTRPLTESSLIVSWLTEHFGRLSTLAKGARRAKSPFSGKLDLLYLAEFIGVILIWLGYKTCQPPLSVTTNVGAVTEV